MAEQTIDSLNIAINEKAGTASGKIDKLVASISKLKDVTGGGVGNLTGIAASIQRLTATLSEMKSQSGIVSSLANSINKLNDVKTDHISASIKTLTDSLKTLGGMDPTLKTMISDLAMLARSGNGGVAENALQLQAAAAKAQATIDKSALTSAKAQAGLADITAKNKQIEESARAAAMQEQQLTDSINHAIQQHVIQAGSAGGLSNMASAYIPESVLPDYGPAEPGIGKSFTASEIRDGALGLEQAMNAASGAARNAKASVSGISSSLNDVSSSGSKAAGFIDSIRENLNSANNSASRLGGAFSRTFRYGSFYGTYFILRQIANTLGGFINNINSYIENTNLFDVAMGSAAESGEKLAQSLQDVLGIDAGEAKRYMGVFEELGTSFGIANKQATTMSENLTQLGYDLASFYNISTSTSFDKLESVYTGQSKAARSLGIDISNARLQQELYNLGINEKVNDLTQADKAELRYIAIMKQTTNAQGDMARTIQTPANALRVLEAQLTITGRAIGSIFIPALEMILPPATAVVEVIGELASELASMLGFQLPKIDYSSLKDIQTDADDAATSVGDIGNNAAKSKKQLDNLIGGFDELNILNSSTDASSAAGAGGGNGNILSGIDLPSYDALADAVKNNIDSIREQLEKYKPLIEEILKTVVEVGAAFLAWKISNGLFTGLETLFPSLAKYNGLFTQISSGLTVVAGLFTFAYLHSEDFRRGLDVLGDTFKDIKGKIDELAKSFNIPALNGEQWTALAASVTIFLGIVAIALGAPVFGAIIVIGGAAVLAIQAIGYAASDSIEPVNLFGEGISEATEKKVKPFIESMDKLDETIKNIKWSGKIVTDSDVSNVKSQVKQIADSIINGLDADKNQALKNLDPLKGLLDSKTYDDIIKANQKHYDTMEKTVTDGEKQINDIMQKAQEEHRGLKQSEYDQISKIEENMKDTGIKYLSASQTESNLIFQNLKDNHTALSAQEASEIVKNSAKQRDTTISDANKQYEGIMTEAQRMYDVGAINKDQYDEIRDAAEQSKNDTIKQAEDQHSKIVDEAKKQAGDLSDQIDWSTGDIKSKWQVFWEDTNQKFSDGWSSIRTFFQKSVPEWWNSDISPWFTKEKWHELADNMKAGIQDKWNETVSWWNQLGPVVWWSNNVAPWFTKGKWDDLYKNIKLSLNDAWNGAVSWWNSLGPVKWWKENVEPWFTAERWNDLGKNAINGLVDGIKSIHIPSPHFEFGWESLDDYDNLAAKAAKKLGFTEIPTLNIDWRAKGGVFNSASVIGVGEYPNASSDPEIVTPQHIIQETVDESNEAVVSVIVTMAEKIIEAINEKETTLELDGDKVTKNVNKRNASRGYNLGLQST